MLLSDLIQAVGNGLLRRRGGGELDPDLSEVIIDDGITSLGPEQIVLATRPDGEDDLVERARLAGCRAVVVASSAKVEAGDVIVLESDAPWTQLFILIRTMLLASHDEASTDAGPGSVHGLADAIAVMVGGSVVLYDRAHRVIAYSVHGHEIDDVRRDAILGRRTPDQWIRRFTVDRTAYQTYSEPGRVVRVAQYADLHTRLRIAVHAGNDVIGEISVAEGAHPFPPTAEEALRRAARLAVPVMLRHRRAQDVEQLSRERAIRSILWDGVPPAQPDTADYQFPATGLFAVGFEIDRASGDTGSLPDYLATERFVHFLSLHLAGVNSGSLVARIDTTYWAVVPAGRWTSGRLVGSLERALDQFAVMGVRAHAALGPLAGTLEQAPEARRVVQDLLSVATSSHSTAKVLTPETSWAELVLAAAQRSLHQHPAPGNPLDTLRTHDEQHDTELLTTLAVFLEEFGSVSAASARLFLHANTLRHRIQRITDISGLDLGNPDQRLAVSLLVRTMKQKEPRIGSR